MQLRTKRIAGEVLVCVDHPRCHDALGSVDHVGVGVGGTQLGGRTDRGDHPVGDGDCTTEQHLARLVHRHHVAAGDDQVV